MIDINKPLNWHFGNICWMEKIAMQEKFTPLVASNCLTAYGIISI